MQSMGTLARGMAADGGPVTKLCPFRFLTELVEAEQFRGHCHPRLTSRSILSVQALQLD